MATASCSGSSPGRRPLPKLLVDAIAVLWYCDDGVMMMAKYVVTNVRFTEEEHEKLRHLALHEQRSMADIVREAVSTYLERKGRRILTEEELANDPFFKVIGIGHSGDGDASTRHDEIIYGPEIRRGKERKALCRGTPGDADQETGGDR